MLIVIMAITGMLIFEQISREFNGRVKIDLYRIYQFSTLLNGCLVGAYFNNRTLAMYSTILLIYRQWLFILDGVLIGFWMRGMIRSKFERISILMQTAIVIEIFLSFVLKNVLTFCA